MRLFFALWPDARVRDVLADWTHACQRICAGRPERPERLHMTAAFLGEVDPSRLPALAAIASALPARTFELHLDRIDFWSNNRIVCATAENVPEQLIGLVQKLATELRAAGFRSERREFVPHVTLLRSARRAPLGVRITPLSWPVHVLSLMETTRIDQKPAYRVLGSWTLAE